MSVPNNFAFIDGANLHYTYEKLEWELDYEKLRKYLSNKFNVTIAHYFLGKIPQSSDLYSDLESYGYNLRLKRPSPYPAEGIVCPHCNEVAVPPSTKYKADCDSFMTLAAVQEAQSYDKAVIVTSDGDFDELVRWLIRQDKLRMVFAPCRKGCSKLLRSAAVDKIAYIDDYKDYLEKVRGGS